jgi:hypothetical protein
MVHVDRAQMSVQEKVSILYSYSEPLGWRPLAFYSSQGHTKASGANLVRHLNSQTTYHFPLISSPLDD